MVITSIRHSTIPVVVVENAGVTIPVVMVDPKLVAAADPKQVAGGLRMAAIAAAEMEEVVILRVRGILAAMPAITGRPKSPTYRRRPLHLTIARKIRLCKDC